MRLRLCDHECGGGLACCRFPSWCDRVLKIENQRVGAAIQGLGELALAVGRHKEHRTQFHAGLFSISAWRRQVATSWPLWLSPRCTKVTMPAFGRERLSRNSATVVTARIVSPANTGDPKRTSVMPRLATVVPSVVSCTDRPITKPSVNMLFMSGRPNSVVLQSSASIWLG